MTRCAATAVSLAIAILSSAATSATGEDATNSPLLHRVEGLERTVEQQAETIRELQAENEDEGIESEIAADESNTNPSRSWLRSFAYRVREIDVEVHGLIDLEFIDAQSEGSRDGVSTFDLHHANLFFDALIDPRLRTHVELEFEHAGDEVEVDQAYVEWSPVDWTTFTAGRTYAPFGIERFVWYPQVTPLVSRPLAFREIIPGNFYQEGLKLSGPVTLGLDDALRMTWEVSVSNGLGEDAATDRRGSRQTRDNNSSRAVTSRVAFVYWPYIEAGASVHAERFNTDGRGQDLLFLGGDLSARWQGFEFRGEYVWASVDRMLGSTLHQDGLYAQLSYTFEPGCSFLERIVPVVRVDYVNLDRSTKADKTSVSLGTKFDFNNHLALKAEYQIAREGGPDRDDDAFMASIVAHF